MKKIAVFAVAACLLALYGCGLKEKDFVGKWTGKVQLTEEERAKAGALAGLADAFTMKLELKADKTFDMMNTQGTWAYADNKISLTTTKMMGIEVPAGTQGNDPVTILVEDGGKKLTMRDSRGNMEGTMVFTKDSK